MLGGKLLVSENDPTGSLVLRLYDIASGQDLYRTMLAPDAIVLKSEEADLTGVVEANGKVRVIDLAAHKEIFHAAVATEHLEKVTDGLLLQDDRNFYVILNKPNDAAQGVLGHIQISPCCAPSGSTARFMLSIARPARWSGTTAWSTRWCCWNSSRTCP